MGPGIEKVTAEGVQRVASTLFDRKNVALTVLGNLDGFKIGREDLLCFTFSRGSSEKRSQLFAPQTR